MTCALSGSLYAQIATTTSLVGTVSDSSGKIIAGARITAVNSETLDTYTAITNQDGNYRIDFVRVGTYNVACEFAGFARLQHTGSIVTINQIVRNDFTLHPGALTESVSVEAVAPVIKTDDATISATVSSTQIANLPMNGRNALMLATTTPGVLPGTKGTQGVPPGQDFIGAGTREIQNSMSLDGISIMNNLITTSPTQPMVETVQEVEVQSGTYSAQYGAYLGVHLNMITKGGTNQIHGNLVEFIRNDAFDARGYFLPATSRKTALRQNQYGFEVDGPVFIPKLYNGKDKTFFMGSWERLRNKRQSLSANNTVMTEQMFAGNFSQTPVIVKDPVEQRNAVRGEYRAHQPAFADRARASAILREAHQSECDHAKFHDDISRQAHERRDSGPGGPEYRIEGQAVLPLPAAGARRSPTATRFLTMRPRFRPPPTTSRWVIRRPLRRAW